MASYVIQIAELSSRTWGTAETLNICFPNTTQDPGIYFIAPLTQYPQNKRSQCSTAGTIINIVDATINLGDEHCFKVQRFRRQTH